MPDSNYSGDERRSRQRAPNETRHPPSDPGVPRWAFVLLVGLLGSILGAAVGYGGLLNGQEVNRGRIADLERRVEKQDDMMRDLLRQMVTKADLTQFRLDMAQWFEQQQTRDRMRGDGP